MSEAGFFIIGGALMICLAIFGASRDIRQLSDSMKAAILKNWLNQEEFLTEIEKKLEDAIRERRNQ